MHTGRSTAPRYNLCHSIRIFLRLQFLIFLFKSFRVSAFISNTPLMFLFLMIHCVTLTLPFYHFLLYYKHMIPNTIYKIKLGKKKTYKTTIGLFPCTEKSANHIPDINLMLSFRVDCVMKMEKSLG
ncbi:hypothetical protein SDC9_118583 [bioreactor metagenome]|uniref:Uncharacterized protein n=1 Tax=bioreactor metagenome TaxID=1076179 RepID=A0A645C249_9ZZZZ